MKKTILLIILCIGMNLGTAFAQFETFTPPQTFEVRGMHSAFGKGKLALATNEGVFLFEKSSQTWESFTSKEGLPSNDVRCLEYTEDNKLYLGLGDGTVGYIYNNIWTTINAPNKAGEIVTVLKIRNNKDSAYGTSEGNLYYKSGTANFAIPISANQSAISTIHTMRGVPGQSEILVAPSIGSGILLFSPASNFSFVVNSQGSPLPSNNVISGDVDETKAYDGTDKGLYVADFSTFPQVIPTIYTASNSMLPSDVIAATEVNAGLQWFGTPAGLAHKNGDNWRVFTTNNSNLPSNNVKQLYIDHNDNGSLWIATNDGKISRLNDYGLGTTKVSNTPQIKYYPNPVSNKLTIEMASGSAQSIITLYNMLGSEVLKTNTSNLIAELNVSTLKKGIYIINVSNSTGVFSSKTNIK